MSTYTEKVISQLNRDSKLILLEYRKLCLLILKSNGLLSQDSAQEYFIHGVSRRLGLIFHCVKEVFVIYSPARKAILTDGERSDLTVYVQALIMNTFGALDNLAWTMAKEQKLECKRQQIRITYKDLFVSMPKLAEYVKTERFLRWHENLIDFRDSLAHRIPLYVPPKGLSPEEIDRKRHIEREKIEAIMSDRFDVCDELDREESSMGTALPLYRHSFGESDKEMILHAQIIADCRTVFDVVRLFCEELKKVSTVRASV